MDKITLPEKTQKELNRLTNEHSTLLGKLAMISRQQMALQHDAHVVNDQLSKLEKAANEKLAQAAALQGADLTDPIKAKDWHIDRVNWILTPVAAPVVPISKAKPVKRK